MAKIIGLPRLSPTMEEGTLTRWIKHEGDEIRLDDLIAEVETDKATMEWRSFDAGVLLKTLVPEGTTLKPDVPVAVVGDRGEDIRALLADLAPNSVPVEAATSSQAEAARAGAAAPGRGSAPGAPSEETTRVFASPSVRRLARDHELDLTSVPGSGPHGRIVQRDVQRLLERRVAEPPRVPVVAPAPSGDGRPAPKVVSMSPTRRTIARRLSESKQTIPHYYLNVDIDASALVDVRRELNESLKAEGDKISLNDIIIRACASLLRRFPSVNVSCMGDTIWQHQVVDVAVAVAVADGLVTPVVRDADTKGVLAIGREVREFATLAREKRLTTEQMTGGTFTISNLGMYDIDDFAAVINPPQAAILAVGAVRTEPVVRHDVVAPGKKMRLTLSCDHRVIDGAVGAEWLRELRLLLQNPIRLVL